MTLISRIRRNLDRIHRKTGVETKRICTTTHAEASCRVPRASPLFVKDSLTTAVLADQAERFFAVWMAPELGRSDEAAAAQMWPLFEGAAAASTVAGVGVVAAARDMAAVLVSASKGCGRG